MSLCDWSAAMPQSQALAILKGLALSHARESGPYSTDLVRMLQADDWVGLCAYEPDYGINADAHHVSAMRQALGFFTKLESLDIGVDKEAVAFRKFVEAEQRCKETNQILKAGREGKFTFHPRVVSAIKRAQRKIAKVLGPCPSMESLKLKFGPGATVSIKRTDASPLAKMASGLECSADMYASGLLPELLREVPHWLHALDESVWSVDEEGWLVETVAVTIKCGNLVFVPKNAKTYRSIMVEPSLNGFLQSGIGDLIARRLRRSGVDITNQQTNQGLALLGSINGELATIDLSSASDTIARELVRLLLPYDWYCLLRAARTSECTYKGNTLALEKFSSMGNGFTFPLETLIFWGLTSAAVPEGTVNAYGDDIICPSRYYDEVVEVLTCCGFEVNASKSYASGPFRESCGCDYYKGINVRPYYQKIDVSVRTLFTLHNWYVRKGDPDRADLVRSIIPRHLRIFGPDGYGDGHLVSARYPKHVSSRAIRRGWGGHFFETITAIPRRVRSPYPGDWVSPLYSIYVREPEPLFASADGAPYETSQGYRSGENPGDRPTWTVPGLEGYKKTMIYTLG